MNYGAMILTGIGSGALIEQYISSNTGLVKSPDQGKAYDLE